MINLKRLFIGLVAVASLALAPVASADGFAGPWDSAHQPSTITSPLITAGAVDSSEFAIDIADSILCDRSAPSPWAGKPKPVMLTVADPSGSITQSVVNTYTCSGPVTTTTTGTPDFGISVNLGQVLLAMPYQQRVGAICMDGWRSTATGSGACSDHDGVRAWLLQPGVPFMYTVSDSTGVLAQGALTGIFTQGWPAPAPPPAPPAPPAASPAPPPTPAPPAAPKPPVVRCHVPHLHGKTVQGARTALHRAHCALGKATRTGRHRVQHVRWQSIRPGKVVAAGTSVRVRLGS